MRPSTSSCGPLDVNAQGVTMMKRLLRICSTAVVGALIVFAMVACGSSSTGSDSTGTASGSGSGTTYKVGVLQLTEHSALDASNKGFVAALDESGISYTIDQQNAQGDQTACQTIASKLAGDGDDLILAIGTPAAQAMAGATDTTPIVGTAITDYESAGLVESNEAPGGNVTGTSDLTPVSDQIDLLHKLLPDAKTVGLLYCTAESNSEYQIKLAEDACAKLGISTTRYTVSSSNEIQSVVESMAGKVDAIYAPTDNTIAAGMSTVSMVANENKIPVICGEEGMVNAGGLASYSIDYYDLGHKAGEMAVKILNGEATPAEMAIEYQDASECKLVTNQETADALGIDLSVLD
jgi:putative ABC transport system substrate-binding protein